MGFLLSVLIFLGVDGVVIRYLISSSYFSPWTGSGEVDVWNVMVFAVLVSIAAGLVVTLIVYIGEKLLYCGRNEFPAPIRSVRAGLLLAVVCAIVLVLHIFHFLTFGVVLVLCALAVIGIMILR